MIKTQFDLYLNNARSCTSVIAFHIFIYVFKYKLNVTHTT